MSSPSSRGSSSRVQRVLRGAGPKLGGVWQIPSLDGADLSSEGDVLAPTATASEEPAAVDAAAELTKELARVRAEADRTVQELSAQQTEELERLRRDAEVAQERAAADLAKQRSHLRRVTAALRGAVAELQAARSEATLAVEARVVELAVNVARRAVGRAIDDRVHDVASLVRGALGEARRTFPQAQVRLFLHSEDARRLEGLELGATVETDDLLKVGDVRVESGDGQVWDGVTARLDALATALLGAEEAGRDA